MSDPIPNIPRVQVYTNSIPNVYSLQIQHPYVPNFDPVTNLPINPEMLEGFALSDPETVELGGTESVYRGQMTTNPVTGEKLYYDAEGNPVTEEQYQLFTEPMETGVT